MFAVSFFFLNCSYRLTENTWLDFYVSEAISGHIVWAWKESLLPPTRGEFYAHEECLSEWFRKKAMSFTFQLFTNYTRFFHTCPYSSAGHSTFLIDPCWTQPSQGWFNSHIGECDDVTLGLWHTWTNSTAVWQISHASDESWSYQQALKMHC